MKRLKWFVGGLIVGSLVAFPLGINFGRGDPLLSNPFARPDLQERAKQRAGEILEDTNKTIHEATE